MNRLVEIPPSFLKQIAENSDRIPRLYYADNRLLRRMFWQRLHRLNWLMNRTLRSPGSCLDLGGGSGVLLPTLSKLFAKVVLIDIEARQARLVQERYGLTNVEIVQADVASLEFEPGFFDAAVAADVLEHFGELDVPLKRLHSWIRPAGMLFTSLPTESRAYVLLRKVFHVEKPWDHHHTGREVEMRLQEAGFVRDRTSHVPLHFPILPLFLVTAWRRN
jgi:2-polyprenyl-3-methyl-5-hydroxy-6-metoxy-1,4-benzoquinol methylase